MFKAFTPEGQLQYQFIDVVQSIIPFYIMRAISGTIYLTGVIVMVYNLIKTAKQGKFVAIEPAESPALAKAYATTGTRFWHSVIERKPL